MAKLRKSSLMLLAGGALGVLSGCVDDSYDLNNIDQTARVEVKDLTLPVEFTGAITFKDVVGDLQEENDLVHVDANGNYVLIQQDDFKSEAIHINPIVANPDVQDFVSQEIEIPVVAGTPIDLTLFNVGEYAKFPFNFDFDMVDNYIRNITSAKVEASINFEVKTGIDCTIKNLVFSIPDGMYGDVDSDYAGTYDQATHTIKFPSVNITATKPFTFRYKVQALDVAKAGGKFSFEGNGEHGVFHLENEIALISGTLQSAQNGTAHLVADFGLSPIDIKTISGSLKYQIDDIIEAANIYDMLPDLLRDPDTQLALVDPQLYIEVNNPFAEYGCEASTYVTLKQSRSSDADFLPESQKSVMTSSPVQIKSENSRFVFSKTENPTFIYNEFAGAEGVKLNNLGYIIYGKGLPEALDFIFTEPMIDSDHVHDFPIGEEVGSVTGRYCFYAPLDFANGSQVIYSQEQTGWDISDLIVTKFQIATDVTSTIPVDVILSAYPIVLDDNGDEVIDTAVKISSTVIEANAVNKPVVIKMEEGKEVKNLQGMKYTVTLKADGTGGALGENISLDMNNVKVTVSGYYDISDDDDDEDDE